MFDWLEQELSAIRTKQFHLVEGNTNVALRRDVDHCSILLPTSYRQFIQRFGNAKLYKKHGYYIVGVVAPPVEEETVDGELLYRIGHYQSSDAYFKATLLHACEEAPVFEGLGGRLAKVADTFDAWLTKRAKAARRTYNNEEWDEIVAGPMPFAPDELRIVEARQHFTCRVVGVAPDGKLLFEVHNGSGMVLPFLSIGARWMNNKLQGGFWIPVSHIRPGQTAVVALEPYEGMDDLSGVEFFTLPDPIPEDRKRYWEFGSS